MNLNYYDLLSTTIIGVAVIAVANYFFLGNLNIDAVVYLALGTIAGYFINAIGSFLEDFYYLLIKGRPFDKLLSTEAGQPWIGCGSTKFYEANTAISRLRTELNDPLASPAKMFGCAMRKVNACNTNRVPTFNAQYVWSRTILTTVLITDLVSAFFFYDKCLFWLIAVALFLFSLNRFKEKSYYYAKEVLSEYLTQTDPEFNAPRRLI